MRDREQAIRALVALWPNAPVLRDEAEAMIDAYESLPFVVTDEMVERLASFFAIEDDYNPNAYGHAEWEGIRSDYETLARAALEAALNGDKA